jgi:hypothetical protein
MVDTTDRLNPTSQCIPVYRIPQRQIVSVSPLALSVAPEVLIPDDYMSFFKDGQTGKVGICRKVHDREDDLGVDERETDSR